jgi:hypothetical protein
MAFSDLEKIMYGYIVGRALPKGTTRMAAKATLAAAVTAGRAASPYLARGAVAAAPPLARAAVNPYIGVPLAVGAGGYALQQYAEESGLQEDINIARDQFLASLMPAAVKAKKRQRSIYNSAMAKAMKAVKASTKGGPKGTLSNAKKTFGQVSKAVSRAKKGDKLSPKGVTGVIKRSISGMFKPKPKKRSSSTKTTYTYRK